MAQTWADVVAGLKTPATKSTNTNYFRADSSVNPAYNTDVTLSGSGNEPMEFGPTSTDGMTGAQMGGLALGAANAYMGYKQYGLAKDRFAHNKKMAEAGYEANRVQANNLISSNNTINQGVTNKSNSLARAAGGLGNQVYKKKALVAGL